MPVPKSALDLPGLKSSGLTLAGSGLPVPAAGLPGLATTPVTGLAGVAALKTTPSVVVPGGLAEPLLIQSPINQVLVIYRVELYSAFRG